jgi:hypothetical protein
MIKFAQVTKDTVVQLGRFNKDNAVNSFKVGIVRAKTVRKVGKNVFHEITVQTGARESIVVHLHNIKDILN